jgi:hypothetical protein
MSDLTVRCGLAAILLSLTAGARADLIAELNRILEENAAASAYARVCTEEPIADQLKSSTMMLLAVNGLDLKVVQLGSAKFNDVVRQELARAKGRTDCTARMKDARERLSFTQGVLQSSRRDAPPSQ